MIKHLPEGLVPFESCGFERIPEYPLQNQSITINCRVDGYNSAPKLYLSLNNCDYKSLNAINVRDNYYKFDIGSYNFGDNISYYFTTEQETSKLYTFTVQREVLHNTPKALLEHGNSYHILFENFNITIEVDKSLSIKTHNNSVQGTSVNAVNKKLNKNFELIIQENFFTLSLKRLSEIVLSLKHIKTIEDKEGNISHLAFVWDYTANYIWGTGERFNAVNQKFGETNGRVVEKYTQQGNQTYLPIPFFSTEQGFGLHRLSNIPVEMCFADKLTINQEVYGDVFTEENIYFGTPKQLIQQYINNSGKAILPPKWAFGVWVSGNGWNNDYEINQQLSQIKKHNYPAEVLVIEAWSDEMTFYNWNSKDFWQDPQKTVNDINNCGMHLVLWQIPIIKHEWNLQPSPQLLEDIDEAITKAYCIFDKDGKPYRITENWFHNSLLIDFTNPNAVDWWFSKRKYLLDMGVEGFKTDGGEFLFDKSLRLHNGLTGLEAHNLYPMQYVGAYNNFMKNNNVNGVTFSRAGYAGAQSQAIHWAGDQLSKWSELKAQVVAGISAGLSGILFWAFDIGGFAGELPSPELYLRATAFACFCPVMQWHSEPRTGQFYSSYDANFNNDRSPWNLAEYYKEESLLTIATNFANIHANLKDYIWEEAQYSVNNNIPMIAHLALYFFDDETALTIENQYMFGKKYMVAPIVDEGANGRDVYLPKGSWKHFFTKEVFEGGKSIFVNCNINEIPVFERLSYDKH